jgi:hypothetical protein
MRVRFIPLMVEVEGRAVVLAHPWPMNLDAAVTGLFEDIGLLWVAISFEKTVVITPLTRN